MFRKTDRRRADLKLLEVTTKVQENLVQKEEKANRFHQKNQRREAEIQQPKDPWMEK